MKLAEAKLESVSPYSQGRYYKADKLAKELPVDYEQRTWRERCHVDKDGFVFIPPMAFANCIKEAAKYLSIQVPGMGKSTYTKHFDAGVLVSDPLTLPLKQSDVQGQWLFLPSDGKPGGGKRVEKCMPYIPEWKGTVTFWILDDIICEDVFRQVLECAGTLIGIGVFRPRNRGYFGRFKVVDLKWTDK